MKSSGVFKYFGGAAVILFLLLPCYGGESTGSSPLNDWKNGYENFDRGEQARDRGHYVDALAAFRAAKECYIAVRNARPDWNIKLINSRIESCDAEIRRIEALLPAGSRAAETVSRSVAATAPVRSSGTKDAELEEYKERLFKALYELDEVKKQLASSSKSAAATESLMKEYRLLKAGYDELNMRYNDLKKRSAAGIGAGIGEKELIDLKINYEMVKRRAEELEKGRQADAASLKELAEKLDMAEIKLKKAAGNDAEREKELEALRKFRKDFTDTANSGLMEINKLKQQIGDLEKELAAERDNFKIISERLKDPSVAPLAENEKLRRENLELNKQKTQIDRDIAALKKQLRETNLENHQLKLTVQKLDNTRKQLAESLLLQQEAAAGKLKAAGQLEKEAARLKKANETLSGEVKSWMIKASSLEKRLEAIGIGDKRLNEQLSKDNRKLTGDNIRLKMDLAKASDDLTKLQSALDAQSEEYKKQKIKLLELADAGEKLEKLQADFAALQKTLSGKAAQEKELADLKKKLTDFQKSAGETEALRKKLREMEKSNQLLSDGKNKLSQLLAEAEKKLENMKAAAEIVRSGQNAVSPAGKIADSGKLAPLPGSGISGSGAAMPGISRDGLFAAAEKALKNGDIELAIWNYREILKNTPDDFGANYRLGKILLSREDYAGADRLLQAARLKAPDNPECILESSAALIGLGKGGNALSLLDGMGKKLDNNYRYHQLRAKALLLSGDRQGAEKELQTSLKLKNDSGETLLLLAQCTSDEKAGAEYYRRAKAISGSLSSPELEKKFGKLIDEKRSMIEFLSSAAMEAEKSASVDNSIWYYRQLTAEDDDSDQWKKRLAAALVAGKMNQGALEELKKVKSDKISSLISALAWAGLGDYGKCAEFTARAVAEKISASDVKNWPVLLGVLREQCPRIKLSVPEKTAEELEKLLKQD